MSESSLYLTDQSGENHLSYERRKAELSPMGTITISIPDGIILDIDPSIMEYFDYLKRSDLIGELIEILLPKKEVKDENLGTTTLKQVHKLHRKKWTEYPEAIAMGNRGRKRQIVGITSKGIEVFPLLAIRYMEFTKETAIFFDEKTSDPILEIGVGFLIDPSDFATPIKHGE